MVEMAEISGKDRMKVGLIINIVALKVAIIKIVNVNHFAVEMVGTII